MKKAQSWIRKKLRMDHFYDETVAEVSTPVVTPVASIIEPIEQKVEMAPPPPPPPPADNTLDNLIDDEGLVNILILIGKLSGMSRTDLENSFKIEDSFNLSYKL